ncbi:MAG TPA: hypothetical protein PLY87_03650 [Planctomycetaceae bacterium]|nr:hypothetical protein [Planctomycetaceae bacterium]HQZ64142.1 hypothetical protein [Planctomycetaceae bacterium]
MVSDYCEHALIGGGSLPDSGNMITCIPAKSVQGGTAAVHGNNHWNLDVSSPKWPKPKSRDVGSFGNLELYSEALKLAAVDGGISLSVLRSKEKGLGTRIRGRLILKELTTTAARDLLVELHAYGWLEKSNVAYVLTSEGIIAAAMAKDNVHAFRRLLLRKMHERFVVPGWFVHRLFTINPLGGDVILPSPHKAWTPKVRELTDTEWTNDLENAVVASLEHNKRVLPSAFPVPVDRWCRIVRKCWNEVEITRSKSRHFGPRKRLATSMHRAAVELLFNNCPFGRKEGDFAQSSHPIPPRSFQSWCPLLDALELVVYTASHPDVMGRLLFPCSVYRAGSVIADFEIAEGVRSPVGECLCLHQPIWTPLFRSQFESSLTTVYGRISRKTGTRYISLQDVRDEVCRDLRISSTSFDRFLADTVNENVRSDILAHGRLMISLESDVQPEGGGQLLRRPVFVDEIPHSLVSISSV